MKRILLIPVFLFAMAHGQQKGDNTIIVKGIPFEQIIGMLLADKYLIDHESDSEIVTKPIEFTEQKSQSMKKYSIVMDIKYKESSKVASISGKYNYSILINNIFGPTVNGADFKPIANLESKSSYIRKSFNVMDNFAKSLKGQITYGKL
jgi:hypothetical protein